MSALGREGCRGFVSAHCPDQAQRAKLNVFDLLPKLYPRVHISAEVFAEVVLAGAGLPGASNVANARWIQVTPIQNAADLTVAEAKFGIGAGELSTIILAKD